MFGTKIARLYPVERAGSPPLLILGGWLCAMLIGCLTIAHVRVAFGFIAFLTLLCFAAAFPAVLAPALVVRHPGFDPGSSDLPRTREESGFLPPQE